MYSLLPGHLLRHRISDGQRHQGYTRQSQQGRSPAVRFGDPTGDRHEHGGGRHHGREGSYPPRDVGAVDHQTHRAGHHCPHREAGEGPGGQMGEESGGSGGGDVGDRHRGETGQKQLSPAYAPDPEPEGRQPEPEVGHHVEPGARGQCDAVPLDGRRDEDGNDIEGQGQGSVRGQSRNEGRRPSGEGHQERVPPVAFRSILTVRVPVDRTVFPPSTVYARVEAPAGRRPAAPRSVADQRVTGRHRSLLFGILRQRSGGRYQPSGGNATHPWFKRACAG